MSDREAFEKQARRTRMDNAIQQAIEALRMTKYYIPVYGFHALAQKVTIDDAIAGLQALQSGEPVAWLCDAGDGENINATCNLTALNDYKRFGRKITPLYTTPQPVVDQRYMNPRLWTKEMSDAWHSNIPDLQKAFDALLSAGKGDE